MKSAKKIFALPGDPDAFYIGWMPKPAAEYRGFIRLVIFAFVVIAFFVASFLVSNQRGFSTGIYDRNELTQLEGLLIEKPFPAIKTFYGKDIYGNPVVKTIPLVNKGKFGADSLVVKMLRAHHDQNTFVSLQGKLIHNHGAVIMEIDAQQMQMHELKSVSRDESSLLTPPKPGRMDTLTLQGQIVDPKCFLGVMKPGEGKPHSDCAIRCIAGGIQPMLLTKDDKGEETLFILRGKTGEAINQQVLQYIGIPVSVSGVVERVDDWLVMKVNPENGIWLKK